MRLVQRQPFSGIGLSSRPVAPLEAALRAAGNLLEAALILLVRAMNGGYRGGDGPVARIAVHW
jgi:hypothetical protein